LRYARRGQPIEAVGQQNLNGRLEYGVERHGRPLLTWPFSGA
jgi:hypothetical protein